MRVNSPVCQSPVHAPRTKRRMTRERERPPWLDCFSVITIPIISYDWTCCKGHYNLQQKGMVLNFSINIKCCVEGKMEYNNNI